MGRVKAMWMDTVEQAFLDFEADLITEDELKQKLQDLNAYDEEAFLDYLWAINYEGLDDNV